MLPSAHHYSCHFSNTLLSDQAIDQNPPHRSQQAFGVPRLHLQNVFYKILQRGQFVYS